MVTSSQSGISSIFPVAIYVQGSEQQTLSLNHTPYTVGRKVDRDLVIADPRVSREHASIVSENGEFFVIDQGSKHGTFVNGERVDRHKLQRSDHWSSGHGTGLSDFPPVAHDLEYGARVPEPNFRNSHHSGSDGPGKADAFHGSGAQAEHDRRAG